MELGTTTVPGHRTALGIVRVSKRTRVRRLGHWQSTAAPTSAQKTVERGSGVYALKLRRGPARVRRRPDTAGLRCARRAHYARNHLARDCRLGSDVSESPSPC